MVKAIKKEDHSPSSQPTVSLNILNADKINSIDQEFCVSIDNPFVTHSLQIDPEISTRKFDLIKSQCGQGIMPHNCTNDCSVAIVPMIFV